MFVHLRCHSHYSFLRGVNPPEEIIAAAVEQKMPAVALTDTNGMYAAVPFYQAARAAKVKPILGVTLEVEFSQANGREDIPRLRTGKSGRFSAPFGSAQGKRDDSFESVPMVLLAADATGYSNLCQLTTLRHLGVLRTGQETFAEDVGRPVTVEELAAYSAGVIALWPAEILRREHSQKPQVQHRHLGHPALCDSRLDSDCWDAVRKFAEGAGECEPGCAGGEESRATKLVGGSDAGGDVAAFREEFAGDACELQSSRRGCRPDGIERRRGLPVRVAETGRGVAHWHCCLPDHDGSWGDHV